jgi:ArsR family transcriptional regulator
MDSLTLLKSITNPTKLRLVALLLHGELCVCELEEITGIRQVNISKNLLSLKDAGVVDVRRDAQRGFYYLCDDFLDQTHFVSHIRSLIDLEPQLVQDQKALEEHDRVKGDRTYVCAAYKDEVK